MHMRANHPVNSHVKLSRVHAQTIVLLVSELYLPSWARSYLDPLSVYLKVQRELAVTEISCGKHCVKCFVYVFTFDYTRCFVRCYCCSQSIDEVTEFPR